MREVPIFSKHTRNYIQESQRQSLFIDLLQQFIKCSLSELQSKGVAFKSVEKYGGFGLEKHPLSTDLVNHCSVFYASIYYEVPSDFIMVESDSSLVEEEFNVENGEIYMAA